MLNFHFGHEMKEINKKSSKMVMVLLQDSKIEMPSGRSHYETEIFNDYDIIALRTHLKHFWLGKGKERN